MSPLDLKTRIESLAPGTQADVRDLTGTQDHYQAVIVSDAFEGCSMMDQHRMVYDILAPEMATEEVHALTLKTFSPSQYEKFMKGNR